MISLERFRRAAAPSAGAPVAPEAPCETPPKIDTSRCAECGQPLSLVQTGDGMQWVHDEEPEAPHRARPAEPDLGDPEPGTLEHRRIEDLYLEMCQRWRTATAELHEECRINEQLRQRIRDLEAPRA